MLFLTENKERLFTLILAVFFTVGLFLHLIPFTRPFVLSITDITMFASNGIVLFFLFRSQQDRRLLYWSISTFIATYMIELAGVRTGMIFGKYHYGETMILQLFDVPVVIAMNWVILMLGSYSIVLWIKIKPILVPIFSSLLIVGFDFLMEEVAMKLDYWQWAGDKIPLQNYIAWFFISLIFSNILLLLKVNIKVSIIRIYFLIQMVFFIGLRIGIWLFWI